MAVCHTFSDKIQVDLDTLKMFMSLEKTGGMLATRRTVNSRRASKAVCYVLGTYNIQQH